MRIVEVLAGRVRLGALELRGSRRRGRFPEEENLDVQICRAGACTPLFSVKAFRGRPPYYRPWVEVHSVAGPEFSLVEDLVLDLAAESLGPGGRLYVEYAWDPVTVYELEHGTPPAASRIGFKLVVRGFTWLKDWYYPEGFMEGAQKLQGEKPLDDAHASRQARSILDELEAYAESGRGVPGAVERARILSRLLGAMAGCQARR